MEGEPKITTVEKVKDPRRVAQGKRLAAISREAKAKKARERQEHIEQREGSRILPFFLLITVIGVIATGAFGGYHYLKKGEEPAKEEPPKQEENVIKRVSRIKNFR